MKKSVIRVLTIVVIILLVPLVAMQFTDEVNWTITDFLIAGILLTGAGSAFEFLATRKSSTNRKVIIGVIITLVFILIWAELAVGIFDTPFAGS